MINEFHPPTALHAAPEAGDDAATIRAIEAGDDVHARDTCWSHGEGLTRLHVAADNNNAAMIAILLENGAEIDAQSEPGVTPLWVACANRHFRAVQALLNHGADQTIAGPSKEPPHRHVSRIIGEFVAIIGALEQRQAGERDNAREPPAGGPLRD